MRRLFVAGNWKMNTTSATGVTLAKAVAAAVPAGSQADVAVCPPFPYLAAVGEAVKGSGVALGAQNCWYEKPGAFTGEVGLDMLQDVGCKYVILGHSERRQILQETDELISRKVHATIARGLVAILCVGELLEQRQSNRTEEVLDAQMTGSLAGVSAEAFKHIVIAYEPVWAIGTGLTATTEQAQGAHLYLRTWLKNHYNSEVAGATQVLYGGSVKPQNAQSLMEQPDVDGALVGGASLKVDDFVPIVQAALSITK